MHSLFRSHLYCNKLELIESLVTKPLDWGVLLESKIKESEYSF